MDEQLLLLGKRADSYRLLAVCFYEIEKELFSQNNVLQNLADTFSAIYPETAHICSSLIHAFEHSTQEDLLVEYARLFVGPFTLLAPPYGSVYLDGGWLMGDSTLSVLDLYNSEGLNLDTEYNNLPDHITAELEFMYYLLYKQYEAMSNHNQEAVKMYAEKHRDFFCNYFLKWAIQFANKIKENSENPFYQALADCLKVFIDCEYQIVVKNK